MHILHGTQANHSCSGRGWGNILSVTATAKICQAYTPYSEPNRPHTANYEWMMGSNFPTFYPDRDLNCPPLKFILCPAQNQITLRFSLKKGQSYHIYEYYVMILLDILKFLTIDVETDPLANCRRHFVAAEKIELWSSLSFFSFLKLWSSIIVVFSFWRKFWSSLSSASFKPFHPTSLFTV